MVAQTPDTIRSINVRFKAYPQAGDVTSIRLTDLGNYVEIPADANYKFKDISFFGADGNFMTTTTFMPNTTYKMRVIMKVSSENYAMPKPYGRRTTHDSFTIDYGTGESGGNIKIDSAECWILAMFTTGDADFLASPILDYNGHGIGDYRLLTYSCGTPGAEIYYTLDGSEPSNTNGTLYTAPFPIEVTKENVDTYLYVKGIAYKDGETSSVTTSIFQLFFQQHRVDVSNTSQISTNVVDHYARTADTIKVTVTPEVGYELDRLYYVYNNGSTNIETDIVDYQFTMPRYNVTIYATFKKINYAITVNASENGTVSAPATAQMGDEVTLTATPADGYELEGISVKDAENNSITVADNKFTMPASTVTISATFKPKSSTAIEQVIIESLRTEAGRVVCSEDFKIYTVTGIDVTRQNGQLEGIYIVKTENAAQKVVVTK